MKGGFYRTLRQMAPNDDVTRQDGLERRAGAMERWTASCRRDARHDGDGYGAAALDTHKTRRRRPRCNGDATEVARRDARRRRDAARWAEREVTRTMRRRDAIRRDRHSAAYKGADDRRRRDGAARWARGSDGDGSQRATRRARGSDGDGCAAAHRARGTLGQGRGFWLDRNQHLWGNE